MARSEKSNNMAKKTSHRKKKVAKAARNAVVQKNEKVAKKRRRAPTVIEKNRRGRIEESDEEEVQRAPEKFDENAEWELEALGGLSLAWGRRKVRRDDGTMAIQHYLKPEEEHRIWVKWTVAYSDGKCWSAEKQENLVGVLPENKRKALEDRMIYPYPSRHDGPDSGWQERKAICEVLGYTPWRPRNRTKSAKYKFFPATEMPDAQPEIDDTEEEESDEETDEE